MTGSVIKVEKLLTLEFNIVVIKVEPIDNWFCAIRHTAFERSYKEPVKLEVFLIRNKTFFYMLIDPV